MPLASEARLSASARRPITAVVQSTRVRPPSANTSCTLGEDRVFLQQEDGAVRVAHIRVVGFKTWLAKVHEQMLVGQGGAQRRRAPTRLCTVSTSSVPGSLRSNSSFGSLTIRSFSPSVSPTSRSELQGRPSSTDARRP